MNKPLFCNSSALVTFLLVSFVATNDAAAQETQEETSPTQTIKAKGSLGVGLNLGVNTMPISLKYFPSDSFSLQFSGPFWGLFWGGYGLGVTTDFLYEAPLLADFGAVALSLQVGGGPDFYWYMYRYTDQAFNWYGVVGIHANIGVQLLFTSIPIDIAIEYHPGFTFSKWIPDNASKPQNAKQPFNVFASVADVSLVAHYYF